MPRRAAAIDLTPEERETLECLCRRASTPQALARRARMILLAADGVGVCETASLLCVWRKTVSQWRARWLAGSRTPASVAERLSDAPRSGAPARITAQEICAIVALACSPPCESGLPITHWGQQDLADEAMRRGLVAQISQRSVGRFLKKNRTSSRIASVSG